MADPDTADDGTLEDQGGKSSKLGLILALVLLLAGAGAGYFGISMGLIPLGGSSHAAAAPAKKAPDMPDVAFVEIPTMIITLPPDANNAHLKFSAKIEVPAEYQGDVEYLMPRIQDILNGFFPSVGDDFIIRLFHGPICNGLVWREYGFIIVF
jgi:flagellar FliL protein